MNKLYNSGDSDRILMLCNSCSDASDKAEDSVDDVDIHMASKLRPNNYNEDNVVDNDLESRENVEFGDIQV
jgi:hypothetical protein